MPSKQEIHIDKLLTNMSVQYLQDDSRFIADKVFPTVPVQKQSDKFMIYTKEDWFRDDAEKRADGAESVGGDYTLTTDMYFADVYAWHKDITEQERVNSDDPLHPDADAVRFVTDKLKLRRERSWANKFFRAGVWGNDVAGVASGATGNQAVQWSNYANSDPIGDLTKFSGLVDGTTGYTPNTLVLSFDVYRILKNHPDIIDRIKFSQKGIVTTDLMAELFDVERILVSKAIFNAAAKGQTANMGYMTSKGALLCYTPSTVSLNQPAAGVTFVWKGLMGSNALGGRVNRIPIPIKGIGTERIEGEMTWDQKMIGADLGVFFNNIIA